VKVLILVRHAKSGWKDTDLADLERPLKKRGRRDAPMMGRRLAERGSCADAIITSPAVRALATADLIADELGHPRSDIEVCQGMYRASDDELLDIIHGLDDAWDRVILIGHNPDMTDLVNRLAPFQIESLPTCGIVELGYDIDSWTQVGSVEAVEAYVDYPRSPKAH